MFKTARHALRSLFMLLSLLAGTAATAGLRVQPMSYDLTPSGSRAQQDLRVENTGGTPLPVELRVERREILPDGTERRSPADDDFLLFPPQGLVPPNGFQTFRVRYIGAASVDRTVLYVVTIAQLPVETVGTAPTGLQFLFHLGTLAAVSPPGAEADLIVTGVTPATTAGKLRIEVRNEGNRYARLGQGRWTFTAADGASETLEGLALQRMLPQPLIEPGTTRFIELPVSAGFNREGARASFELARPSR